VFVIAEDAGQPRSAPANEKVSSRCREESLELESWWEQRLSKPRAALLATEIARLSCPVVSGLRARVLGCRRLFVRSVTMKDSSVVAPVLDRDTADVLEYLENHFSAYPFNRKLDTAFITELAADFQDVNLLEQIKTFRWYYDDDLSRLGNPRAALRRWMVRCWDRFR
jgi:hypothetical protein